MTRLPSPRRRRFDVGGRGGWACPCRSFQRQSSQMLRFLPMTKPERWRNSAGCVAALLAVLVPTLVFGQAKKEQPAPPQGDTSRLTLDRLFNSREFDQE